MADMASGTRLLSELSSGFGSSLSSELDRWEFFVLYLQYGIVFTLFLAAAGVLLYKMSWNLQLAYTLAAKLLRRGGAPSAEKPSTKRVRSLAACAFMLQLVGCRACGRGCVAWSCVVGFFVAWLLVVQGLGFRGFLWGSVRR